MVSNKLFKYNSKITCSKRVNIFRIVTAFSLAYIIKVAAAAAAAKSLQLCPTLCDTMDSNPPGSSVRRILQARILEGVAISFSI